MMLKQTLSTEERAEIEAEIAELIAELKVVMRDPGRRGVPHAEFFGRVGRASTPHTRAAAPVTHWPTPGGTDCVGCVPALQESADQCSFLRAFCSVDSSGTPGARHG
jgi:hypothetical protein